MSNKKERLEKSKLSSTVLDYYYKFGQNRDLEKYLRMRRQSTSKSSSDSSLQNYASADSPTLDCKRITKSMEKLNLSDQKTKFTDKNDENNAQSDGAEKPSTSAPKQNKSKDQQKSTEPHPIKIEKKTQQQWKGKSKSKSYNFSMESSIEINLPSTSSMPILPTPATQTIDINSNRKSHQIEAPKLESSETQTDTIPMEPTSTSQQKPKRVITTNAATATPTAAEMGQETSPASSVASAARLRLEWDSMADIGYNRFIDFKSQSNSNLTTFERSALTKFFAKRGLNFEDNLVILAPPATSTAIDKNKSPLQKRKFTQSAIEMREAQQIRADLTSSTKKLSPASDKKLWERALMKYREKYGKTPLQLPRDKVNSSGAAVGCSDTTLFTAPQHHSTPVAIDVSKISQCSTEEFSEQTKNTPIEIQASNERKISTPPPQHIEKWCQTSLIGVEAIGIQVEEQHPQIQRVSKSVQIEIEQVHESTQKDDDDMTTATSFEFIAPSAYNINRDAMISASESNKQTSAQQDDSKLHHACAYIPDESPDDKENIPPIDDKENIPPPPPVPSRSSPLILHNSEQPNVFKTPPDQSIAAALATADRATKSISANGAGGDSSMLSNDLQIGVDLINALIDSRGTDAATKKKLIRKIVRHLLRSKDTKDITQMIMSYTTEKSNSKISGVSMLNVDEGEKSADDDRSRAEQTGKDTISGISTLNSSSSNVSQAAVIPIESNQMPSQNNEQKRNSDDDTNQPKMEDEKNVQKKRDEENSTADSRGIKEWLLPVTQSEIEKELSRKLSKSQQQQHQNDHPIGTTVAKVHMNVDRTRQPECGNNLPKIPTSKSKKIFDRLEMEKKTHFDWIDQEIEHLKNLKKLLKQINTSESDEHSLSSSSKAGGNISDERTNSVYAKYNRNYFTIYENFQRTRKQHEISSNNASQATDESSTLIDSSKSSDNSSRFHGKMGSKSQWIHKTTLESPPSTISSGSKFKPNNNPNEPNSPPISPLPLQHAGNNRAHLVPWDSHLNMQQLVKNRTKLKTPNSDSGSTEAYLEANRTKFDRKCAKSQNMNYHQGKSRHRPTAPETQTTAAAASALIKTINARDQPIYTKPYSSDSYSDIGKSVRHRSSTGHGRLKGKQQDDTSVTVSDGFLSPNSISIGVAANSTSNTTTHQYDTKISVGLQTTDTLQRMPIIQMKNTMATVSDPIESITAEKPTATRRVNKFTVNKQLQVRPESLAYIIVFKDNDAVSAPAAGDVNANLMAQERGNLLYANSQQPDFMSQHSSGNSDRGDSKRSDVKAQNDKDHTENEMKYQIATDSNGNRSQSTSSSSSSFENLTLQQYLQARRPNFYANAEHRRKCLNNLHNLRQQRNEQRKKLLATNISSNAKMLNRNMKRLLPPPPLAQMRIFKSREIISQTRRKYQKLPEIQQRQQMECDMKIRRNHRMLVNMFSKNLQKHVLSGKTDLSNSMMIN